MAKFGSAHLAEELLRVPELVERAARPLAGRSRYDQMLPSVTSG